MKKQIFRLSITTYLLLIPIFCSAQLTLISKGKAVASIELADSSTNTLKAAKLLNLFVGRISGTQLPLNTGKHSNKGTIRLGGKTNEVGHDGFTIDCKEKELTIKSGGGKGVIYGVCTLLEKYMDVSYFSQDCYTLTKRKDISIPFLKIAETPAFRYRQTQCYATTDSIYYDWFRLEDPKEVFIDNMWVHTFNRLLPSNIYGNEHPEYYSFINGERRPGTHSQWCLTNPAVFDTVCKQLDSIFAHNPHLKMISVSQNDGNNTQCACKNCKKVEEEEGSPSGNFIRFVNKLAARYPDKEFSTLAYLFTMHPPKQVRPLSNVNIMLCDIDCKREVPLTDNVSGQDFVKALEGWGRICNNIFVWDYGINFDNYISPFPNFHILQKNLQLFLKNHATMVFEQIGGTRGGDFSEMRAYMIAKLMWNPQQNSDSLMYAFMKGYYGNAAPFLYQYQKIMQGALLANDIPLWIYDSPISHKDGMLRPYLIKVYNELFDKAEYAVRSDEQLLKRVRIARLSLQYSELEIARTNQNGNRVELIHAIELFKERTSQYGVTQLNERNNSPIDYCNLYLQRFLPKENKNLARGAKILWNSAPEKKYQTLADTALTDGLYGGTTFVESWVGWEGRDADFVIDLGENKQISRISTDFLHQLGAWILLPQSVTYSVSTDNKTFSLFGQTKFEEDRDIKVKFVQATSTSSRPISARYIRIEVKSIGLCPSWHYGVGYPAWFFMDEITVE